MKYLIFIIVLVATIGCQKSNNLIIQYCKGEQKSKAVLFYEGCIHNWGKLTEYGCQVRSVENYCGAHPKVRGQI